MADPIEPRRERLARFLRQRGELGVAAWILEDLTAEAVERAVQGARAGDPGPPAALRRIPRPEGAAAPGPIAPAPGGDRPSAGPGELPTDYDELEGEARNCTRCRLCEGRTQVVFSDGSRQARVMVVGEAPGANEDRTGLPFVGPAGKLLDLLLASVDLSRDESVYICNVIKCRPPQNRNPRADEIEMCAPYLHRQIELVQPEVILAVGTFAGKLLSGLDRALGKLRGEVHSYRGTPLVVTYHPAALLRNSGWTRPTWEDLQLLRGVLDGG
ncbi:MAG: uracil-DNA glycosylase [Gemmatimonadota bacterium]